MFHFTSGSAPDDGTPTHRLSVGSKSLEAKNDRRQITRNRTSYSCLTCRRRKVKCDKVHPVCGGCKKSNEECLYTLNAGRATNGDVDAGKQIASIDLKKRKISPNREGSESSPSNGSGTTNSVSPTHLKAIEQQLHRLSALVDSLRANGTTDDSSYLRNLLTPVPSSSEPDTEDGHSLPNLSLGMFQTHNNGTARDATELSRPLSSLKLGNAEKSSPEDPFWSHISEEINLLNHMMRRQNTYVSATSIQTDKCPSKPPETLKPKEQPPVGKDDLFEPQSFQKEAGITMPSFYDPDRKCSVCTLMPFVKSTLLQDLPVRCSPDTAKEHLLRHIPSRTQSNVLFRCWLSGVHPILPILIPVAVQKMHEAFWSQLESSSPTEPWYPDLGPTALMYAIWYSGSLSISANGLNRWFPNTTRSKLSASFHDQVVFALHLASFSRNTTLQTLAAFIIICSLPISEEDPTQAVLYLQLIVRLSLTMGLHREPTLFNMSVAEEGMRRRLWWHVIQLDISQVVTSGYPSLISEAFVDTRITCEDHDAVTDRDSPIIDSDAQMKPRPSNGVSPPAESQVWESYRTFSHVARAKSILSCALRGVVSIHMSTKPLTNTDMQEMKRIMTAAGDQVNEIIKKIPAKGLPELGFTPDGPKQKQNNIRDCETSMGDPISLNELGHYTSLAGDPDATSPLAYYYRQKQAAYNKWARISLSMMNDKLHCVAYAPFLKNTKSKLWSVGRQCALHNCHSFLRKFVSIVSDAELEPFWWSWPAMYGPMHSALIVLVDLYERPGSVEAPRSRELIDQVFAFSSPERGIVGGPNGVTVQRPLREGGVEAWDMLRGLRSAAWQKAGLDPRVLWTEADEVDIGFAKPLTDAQKIAQSLREDSLYDNSRENRRNGGPTQSTVHDAPDFDSGVRHVFTVAQAEMLGNIEPEGHPCSRALRNRFLDEIENDERLNPIRGLAWRSDQQKMPFPLSGRMEACSGHAAQQSEAPSHLLDINTHIPRPATESVPYRNHHEGSFESSNHANGTIDCMNGCSTDTEGDWAPPQEAEQPNLQQFDTPAHGPQNGTTWTNGFGHNIHDHVQDHQYEQSSRDTGRSDNQVYRDVPSTDPNLGFDWERWDSVFGQYSAFTDLMEDVTWHEYVVD